MTRVTLFALFALSFNSSHLCEQESCGWVPAPAVWRVLWSPSRGMATKMQGRKMTEEMFFIVVPKENMQLLQFLLFVEYLTAPESFELSKVEQS